MKRIFALRSSPMPVFGLSLIGGLLAETGRMNKRLTETALSGWQTSTHGMRDYAELPSKAREYVERLAELVGVGFSLVSTGAVRDETILVNDSVLTRWYPALAARKAAWTPVYRFCHC